MAASSRTPNVGRKLTRQILCLGTQDQILPCLFLLSVNTTWTWSNRACNHTQILYYSWYFACVTMLMSVIYRNNYTAVKSILFSALGILWLITTIGFPVQPTSYLFCVKSHPTHRNPFTSGLVLSSLQVQHPSHQWEVLGRCRHQNRSCDNKSEHNYWEVL